MNTLFVYCSDDDTVNSLCNESALKKRDTKALKLSNSHNRSTFSRYFGINRPRRYSSLDKYNVDIEAFEKIIFACDGFMGEIPPEISAFIAKNNLRYKNIDCIVFGDGKSAERAKDSLRVRVSLSGGTVRNVVSVSRRELKYEEEDVLFSVRHRLAV